MPVRLVRPAAHREGVEFSDEHGRRWVRADLPVGGSKVGKVVFTASGRIEDAGSLGLLHLVASPLRVKGCRRDFVQNGGLRRGEAPPDPLIDVRKKKSRR